MSGEEGSGAPAGVAAPGAAGPDEALARLARVLFGADAAVSGLRRLSGGASQELWSFDIAAAGGSHPLILRRNPPGFAPRATATPMPVEAAMIARAGEAGVPVPGIVHVLSSGDGLGAGYVMTRVAGESLARRILRDDRFAAARQVLAQQLGAAAARIHAIDPAGVPLRESGVAAALAGAEAQYRANGMARPVVEWALRWLHDHRPDEPVRRSVVHGDLRNGNILVDADGLRAVLDWEVVHLGDPMADLGWLCVTSWRFGAIDRPVGGLGTREALFDGYEAASGRRPVADRVRFHEVLGTLRWGLSCAMMAREFQAGDRSVERAAIGRRASETEIDLMAILAPLTGMRHA